FFSCPEPGSPVPLPDTEEATVLLGEVLSREPTPDFAAEVAEECQRLLAALPEDELELRQVAGAKMEGYSNAEIAARLGWVERTVKRRLAAIRKLWAEKEGDS